MEQLRHSDSGTQQLLRVGAFLRSRRERIQPEVVGVAKIGRRRVPGLRREEVAALAGISVAWYTHLEQGREVRPSRRALGSIATALRLDDAERAYLFQLADGAPDIAGDARRRTSQANGTAEPGRTAAKGLTCASSGSTAPTVRRLLDAFGTTPTVAIDRCWDLVGGNAPASALLPGLTASSGGALARNMVAYVLTNPTYRTVARDWARVARLTVDGLRASLATLLAEHPGDLRAAVLIQTLDNTSPEFRTWWAEHGLWTGNEPIVHVYHHARVGLIECEVALMDVRSAPGVTLISYVPCDAESAARLEQLRSTLA